MPEKRQPRWHNPGAFVRQERGVVLTTSLILLAVLSLMGATAILTTMTDARIASNLKHHARAFYYAEAGVNFTLARLPGLIADGTLVLSGALANETLAEPISAPANFTFDPIGTFTRVGNSNTYQFSATGRSATARVTLHVVFRRAGNSVSYGLFGNQMVDLRGNGQVFSYDSANTPNPTILDVTGEGDIGSNEEVRIDHEVYVNGRVDLGADAAGNPGSYTVTGNPDPTDNPSVDPGGWPPANVDRINPDPLGAVNGDLADEITQISGSNDNLTSASPAISGNVINVPPGNSQTLSAGNYYLRSVTLNLLSELIIDTTAGPVAIYLTGAFNAKDLSYLTYTSSMVAPTDFTIYSNATAPITLRHQGEFKGMIYAPYASVEIDNGGGFGPPTVYGLIWANRGILHEPGLFYFDTALKTKFSANNVNVISWKEVTD